ncbi:hypothetical protein DSLPV1_066 [Dishui lake phycodnavirus 1]|uniref:hypothetical protein n=1 Tax=Dishui lake phycodnavirus 1 TaxID=2079134 RepID=UPI000CD6B49B|nr:hypothetical protein C5Y57_gp066 [Dishui lake phycodnavirus 1]AUT19037.1 hypothetical protein DSLPV1_066 [Dishui lake phycodnavirus 1]
MRLYVVAIILAVLFVITYDPKSRTLEKYIMGPLSPVNAQTAKGPAPSNIQCKHPHFQARNFGEPVYDCPKSNSKLGAIHSA